MGGGDIDLRSAHMANGTARLEINLIMGGVNLFVPEDWSVEYQGAPIMAVSRTARSARRTPRRGASSSPASSS